MATITATNGSIATELMYQCIVQIFNNQGDNMTEAEAKEHEHHYLKRMMCESAELEWLDQVINTKEKEVSVAIKLNEIYIPLYTTSQEENREQLNEKRKFFSAVDMLDRERKLVIMGAPGSGKSALVNFIVLCMAGEILEDKFCHLPKFTESLPADDPNKQQQQSWQHPALIPLKIILRDFASSSHFTQCPDLSPTLKLHGFIKSELKQKGCESYFKILEQRLRRGEVLILFDGLDEVPSSDERREQIKRSIEDFYNTWSKNRYLVTVRPYAYQQQHWKISGFMQTELAGFNNGQIALFIEHWYSCLGKLQARAEKLKKAVLQTDALHELAERPLLLSLMAFLHSNRHELPERKADLYERLLELLIEKWEKARYGVLDKDDARKREQESLTDFLQVDVDEIRKALERLAFAAHAHHGNNSGTADIAAKDLSYELYQLAENSPEEKRYQVSPPKILDYLRDRVGILYQRGGDGDKAVYTFPHRSFQEYLAAAYFRREEKSLFEQYPGAQCEKWQELCVYLLMKEPDRWREVIILAGGINALKDPGSIWTLLDELHRQQHPFALRLAAQILTDNLNRQNLSFKHQKILDKIHKALPETLASTGLAAVERVAIGQYLAKLGELRAEVLDVNAMEFCLIPSGDFFLGSTDADDEALENEKRNSGSTPLNYDYAIGKYPITVAQFRQSPVKLENENALQGLANNPVVYISWDEAIAFCDWLTNEWKDKLPKGWRVDLASEREWEKAARGGLEIPQETRFFTVSALQEQLTATSLMKKNDWEQRVYPWGNDIDNDKLNYDMSIGSVSAVGCYPQGQSPYGSEEMSGNVWEWTRSCYENPYQKTEAQWLKSEQRDSRQSRVLRGGAFYYSCRYVRCAVRDHSHPDSRLYSVGFRVVLSPLPLNADASDR